MSVRVERSGTVTVATLENDRGLRARVMSWGATLLELTVPDRNGVPRDVVLGFDDPRAYQGKHPYFGCVVGRFANRIAGARFELDGRACELSVNEGRNQLHGGVRGFSWVDWQLFRERSTGSPEVSFRHVSPPGDEGYPGELSVEVTYSLTEDDALRIEWEARTTEPTHVNLTHHAYWNLAGEGDVRGHELQLYASRFLPVSEELLPTGELRPVEGTPMDFRMPVELGTRLGAPDTQLERGKGGFDHCWVLDHPRLAARLYEPLSGRVMEVSTTQPALQFYSGNQLEGTLHGKRNVAYGKYGGLCLETQHLPDSPHHPSFPTTVLRPGQTYAQSASYRFSTVQRTSER